MTAILKFARILLSFRAGLLLLQSGGAQLVVLELLAHEFSRYSEGL